METALWQTIFLASAIGYLCGSVPYGLVLTKALSGQDIRKIGSGNIGATNVLRTGNKKLALATLILDAAKGAVAVFVAEALFSHDAAALAGLASVIGHCFPVWLRFSGGKGVATGMAAIAAVNPLIGLVMGISWLATAYFAKLSSLAALASYLVSALCVFILPDIPLADQITITAIAGLSWIRHHQNIVRLIKGTEEKISFHKK